MKVQYRKVFITSVIFPAHQPAEHYKAFLEKIINIECIC